jgi:hypothetical protein
MVKFVEVFPDGGIVPTLSHGGAVFMDEMAVEQTGRICDVVWLR